MWCELPMSGSPIFRGIRFNPTMSRYRPSTDLPSACTMSTRGRATVKSCSSSTVSRRGRISTEPLSRSWWTPVSGSSRPTTLASAAPTNWPIARPTPFLVTSAWISGLIEKLDLTGITLVGQDWGGMIGLGALATDVDRFARVVATNTVLHTADPALAGQLAWSNHGIDEGRVVLQEALVDYVLFYYRATDIVPSMFVHAVSGPLSDEERRAYDAPFPDPLYKAGVRQLTGLIPLTRNDPNAAINRHTMSVLATFDRPFLTAFSDGDPATKGWDQVFQDHVPGAVGQAHQVIAGAGHFVQEQKGEELGRIVAQFVATTLG